MKQLFKKILGPLGLNYLDRKFERVDSVLGRINSVQEGMQHKLAADILAVRQELALYRQEDARYQAIVQSGLTARVERLAAPSDASEIFANAPLPVGARPFEDYLRDLEALSPVLFPVWLQLFENGQRAYRDLPKEASCSTWTNEFAMLFRDYVDAYGRGSMLDIGCGPHGDPVYFVGHPAASLCAIEPLPMEDAPRFSVVRAFCEFLPWADDSFDTVVIATSLDHVLSLKTALEEVRRVLKTGGKVLVWLGSLPGMKEYDEQNSVPLDDFHLFQFDEKWATPLFEKYFSVVDLSRFRAPIGCDWHHCFYCLQK